MHELRAEKVLNRNELPEIQRCTVCAELTFFIQGFAGKAMAFKSAECQWRLFLHNSGYNLLSSLRRQATQGV